jgi:hypothetical protein
MFDNLKRRRLNLLWYGLHASTAAGVFELGVNVARAAGYEEVYGEPDYMDVLAYDIERLEHSDRAIVQATHNHSYGLQNIRLYKLTAVGRQMLIDEGFILDSQW